MDCSDDFKTQKKDEWKYEPHYSLEKISNEAEEGNVFVQGSLFVTRFSRKRGRVETDNSNFPLIRIVGLLDLNRAIRGDTVVVFLYPIEKWELNEHKDSKNDPNYQERFPTGKIVRIIARKKWFFCGSLRETSLQGITTFLHPINQSFPQIRIKTRQKGKLFGKRIVVRIDTWEIDSKYPNGHYVNTIGKTGEYETENKLILIDAGIPFEDFTPSVLKCLPQKDWFISDEIISTRNDLRKEYVFSIDPPGCTDIDDALHCKVLDNGNYEIGVHIADVTYFVKENTELDKEALNRSTSVYLSKKRINMLPRVLTEVLCSIRENEDKLTFSVIWEIDSVTFAIISTKFCKSVVHSRHSLTYEQAQNIINDLNINNKLAVALRILNKTSKILRKKRFEQGALALMGVEIKFTFDQDLLTPTDVNMYKKRDTNSLVEEFMLLANIYVAKETLKVFPEFAIVRKHPAPIFQKFQRIQKYLSCIGKSLDFTSSKTLNDSLDKMRLEDNKYFNSIIRTLVTRLMQQAVYVPGKEIKNNKDSYHYGLALPLYTHFTSPIRRYADILVHRFLNCAIGNEELSDSLNNIDLLKKYCDRMNERNRLAKVAARQSVVLHILSFYKSRSDEIHGYVVGVYKGGISILLPQHAYFYYKRLEGFNFNINEQTLKKGEKVYKIFDKLKVKVSVETDLDSREVVVMEILDDDVEMKENEVVDDEKNDVEMKEKNDVFELY